MKALFLIGMLFFVTGSVCSQEIPASTKQQLENLADVTEEETEDDAYLQQLNYLKQHPLNINTATEEDLQAFYFLTDLQIINFINYRNTLGAFISLYELQSIPYWDLATIYKLLPFLRVQPVENLQKQFLSRFKNGESTFLFRTTRIIEKSKGFATGAYLGDRNRLLARYRYQFKNLLQYGMTADKDAGERLLKEAKGFDFYSFHLFFKKLGIIKSVAIGDFTTNLGQGLIQWQSLAFKKSAEVLSVKRQSPVLKPYTSSGEFYFNRGAGITIEKKNLEVTIFGSFKKISANTNFDTINKEEIFTSFLSSGLHRTRAELADKNSVQQISFGGNLQYHFKHLQVGVNGVQYHFDKSFQKANEPYNIYTWKGKLWNNESVDYSWTYKNMHLFGEIAIDRNLNNAFVNGVLISLHSKADLTLLHRTINKAYQAVYGNAFTENIQPANENGLYTGLSLRPTSSVTINAYADVYSFPWLRYRIDAPGRGKEYFFQVTYQPNKDFEIYSRYRTEDKDINELDLTGNLHFLRKRRKQNWRTHFSYVLSPKLTLRSRVDLLWYDNKKEFSEDGFLIYGEMHIKANSRLAGNLRLQYFETGGYNSRLYAFENDVLFSYSIPAFFGKGFRYYCNINYECSKKLSLWLRWAQSIYAPETKVGSGLDEMSSKFRSEVKLQLYYAF